MDAPTNTPTPSDGPGHGTGSTRRQSMTSPGDTPISTQSQEDKL
jgi:hypothetical protein